MHIFVVACVWGSIGFYGCFGLGTLSLENHIYIYIYIYIMENSYTPNSLSYYYMSSEYVFNMFLM